MAQRTKKVEEVIEPVETEIEQIQPSPQPQHPWRYRKAPKVCIVGCADSKNMAPFLDPSYEIWGVNNLFVTQLPNARYDRWFEIHNIEYNGKNWSRRESLDFRGQTVDDYVKSLARLPFPVFMQKEWSQIPNAVEYPLKEILDTFGDYFTNTISWEIALAIYLGFEEIKIVGVDMAVGCLAPETKVLTTDLRWVESATLTVGDELIGFDEKSDNGNGKTRRWRKTTVTACPEISRPCYKIYFEDGSTIIASEKHGWLTHGENINRWKTTDELVTSSHRGGKPTRVLKLVDTWDSSKTWGRGYLAAAFDGEGHFCQNPRNDHKGSYTMNLGFSQKENAMSETVEQLFLDQGLEFSKRPINGESTNQYHVKGGKPEIMRCLGSIRPKRLLEKFDPSNLGEVQAMKYVAVEKIEYLGEQKVIGLETECKTFVAEGLASHNSEYMHQRPSCEFFLGVAAGKGIIIDIPDEADLLKTRFLYGFGEKKQDKFAKKMKKIDSEMFGRQQKAENVMKQQEIAFHQYTGARQALGEIQKIWSNLGDTV